MLRDPLKAIICNILNRAVCTSKSLQRGKQDQLVQFYIKVISFSSVATSFLRLWCVRGLWAEWMTPLHVRGSHSEYALMTWLALGTAGEKSHSVKRWKGLWMWTHSVLNCLPLFPLLSCFKFRGWACLFCVITFFSPICPWIMDKWNSNMQKVEPQLRVWEITNLEEILHGLYGPRVSLSLHINWNYIT